MDVCYAPYCASWADFLPPDPWGVVAGLVSFFRRAPSLVGGALVVDILFLQHRVYFPDRSLFSFGNGCCSIRRVNHFR